MFEVYYRTRNGSFVSRYEERDEAENLRNYIKSFGGFHKGGLEFLGLAEDGIPIEEPNPKKPELEKPEPKKEVWGAPPRKRNPEQQRKKRSPTLQQDTPDYKIEWGRMKKYETSIEDF